MSSKDKLFEILGQLAFGNHSIQISIEATAAAKPLKLEQYLAVNLEQ